MKKEINFIPQFEQQQKQFEELAKTITVNEQHNEMDNMDEYLMDFTKLDTSQHEIIRNKERYHLWTEVIYPLFSDTAEAQGGKITLIIDEESLTGNLIYFGYGLVFNDLCNNKELLCQMITHSDDYYIDPKDGMIELVFSFRLYDVKKIVGHSGIYQN